MGWVESMVDTLIEMKPLLQGGTPFWNGARDEGNPDTGLLIEAPCREQTARSPPVFPQGTEGGKTKTPRDLTAHGRLIQTKPLQWEREEQDGTAT